MRTERRRTCRPPSSPRFHGAAVVCWVVVAALLAAVPAGASKKLDRRRALHRTINERWEGAECVLRMPLEFKKRKPDDGWYESRRYVTGEAIKIENLTFRLKLRSLDPLRSQMASGHLVAGTRFQCEGWRFRDDNGRDNAYLALRTATGEVEGEMHFWAGSNHPELKQLESVEQYVRLNVLDVRAADERLTTVAAAAPALEASPARPAAATSTAASAAVYDARLELLGVSVQPSTVRAGESISLVAHYAVAGLPPDAAFQTIETRRLTLGERELVATREEIARANGAFYSSRDAAIPANATPGIYRLEIVVELAGQEAAGSALFEVQR